MTKIKKFASVGKECVACGCCTKVCPRDAISVYLGVIAKVNSKKCIGCGKCAKTCPAAVIEITQKQNGGTGGAA